MKKAQSSIEFIAVVMAVIFLFGALAIVLQSQAADKTSKNKDAALENLALNIQSEISLATKSSDGYSRTFALPETALGTNYTVALVENLVYISTPDGKHALALPVQNVTGQIQKGQNTIRKSGTTVHLNE